MSEWLDIHRGQAPLIISMPHTGAVIPDGLLSRLISPWRARKDTDWWVEKLYAFALELGATLVRTRMSRTVIDVNRDPAGNSLYPGQAVTSLCPIDTFDGEPLYRAGQEPSEAEIAERRSTFFDPYHAAIAAEIDRLRAMSGRVVLYDAHAIRSRIPRLFEGRLSGLNIGTYDGRACDAELRRRIAGLCENSAFTSVVDGRFKGGWTTRHYGHPEMGVHAVQMELACSAYLDEPEDVLESNWPPPFDAARAADLQSVLKAVVGAALDFTRQENEARP